MILLAFSAAFVGLIHSLAPGHWLPVVLTVKTRRWPWRRAILGAMTAASGHILISVVLGTLTIWLGAHFITSWEEDIERWGGLALAFFGLAYTGVSLVRHSHCHGHEHHGPDPAGSRAPFFFLFSLGFTPCVAVIPVFIEASSRGNVAVGVCMAAFSLGVLGALVGATLLVSLGLMKLDHPILEHHADKITGLGVALMGLVLFLWPHH